MVCAAAGGMTGRLKENHFQLLDLYARQSGQMGAIMNERASCITINCGCCGNTNNGIGDIVNNTYSFDEIVIGTWVDGKTIYRKVIEGKLAAASGTSILFADVSELNIDQMLNIQGFFSHGDGSVYGMIQTTYSWPTGAVTGCISMFYRKSTGKLEYHFHDAGKGYSGCITYITIEYTKQDTATK